MNLKIDQLGAMVQQRRGANGVRAAAKEIGISPSTLSRIENGHIPDLDTFAKLCAWLDEDPNLFLGLATKHIEMEPVAVHLRKQKTASVETAQALGKLILRAQEALEAKSKLA